MAKIEKFEKYPKDRYSVHGPVKCHYCVFTGPDGKRYLQLDTMGSSKRQEKGKMSQSIQLDSDVAAELKKIIDTEL